MNTISNLSLMISTARQSMALLYSNTVFLSAAVSAKSSRTVCSAHAEVVEHG